MEEVKKDKKDVLGHRKRLQEKYLKSGYTALADYEVLEFLLFSLISRRDTKPIAKEILKKYKSLKNLSQVSIEELKEIDGIGDISAIYLKFISDMFSYYYEEQVTKNKKNERVSIKTKNQLINYLRTNIGNSKQEEFKVVFLNSNNEILGLETLFSGTIDKSAIYPRKILERALFYNARSIVFSHNHPSGNTLPSGKDIEVTRSMSDFFKMVDINVLDHIIIGETSYFSFLEEGRL